MTRNLPAVYTDAAEEGRKLGLAQAATYLRGEAARLRELPTLSLKVREQMVYQMTKAAKVVEGLR